MGLCVDLDEEHGIEIRRESIKFNEDDKPQDQQTIFGRDFHVEIEKVALLKLLKFFDNPDHRMRAFGRELLAKYDGLIPEAEKLAPSASQEKHR